METETAPNPAPATSTENVSGVAAVAPCSLLPCPFCNATPAVEGVHNGPRLLFDKFTMDSFVTCPFCEASGPTGRKEEAVKMWNERAGDDEVSRLRKIMARAERFMRHNLNCPARAGEGFPCECGMVDAWKAIKQEIHTENADGDSSAVAD